VPTQAKVEAVDELKGRLDGVKTDYKAKISYATGYAPAATTTTATSTTTG